MIVYAYYGSGKTTLCESAKDSIFCEIEEEFGQTEKLQHINNISKDHIVFVNGHIGLLENDDVQIDMALKQRVDDAWNARNESYIKDAYEIKSYGNHVANGYETEGLNQIVKGQLHGTWSTCTTSSQNDTTEELVISLRAYAPLDIIRRCYFFLKDTTI